jgi:hypothetical protein
VKIMPLAALLALGFFAFARADEGAYKNLVGMAQAAATDRGPDADDAPERAATGTEALKDALTDVRAPRAAAGVPASPAAFAAAKADPAPIFVSVPAAPKPRLWTRLYSTLVPSSRRPAFRSSGFEAAASTWTVRAPMTPLPALMPPPDSDAVAAGERRGLAELMSVSGQ